MIDALRDEFPEQLLLFGVSASAAREFGQMPQRVPRERRITVDDAQEERAGLGSGLPVLQQTPEQIIVIVSRERVGVVLHHPAQQRFGSRLIIPSSAARNRACRSRSVCAADDELERLKKSGATLISSASDSATRKQRGSRIEDRR